MNKIFKNIVFASFLLSACSSAGSPEPKCPLVSIEKNTADAFFFKEETNKSIIDKTLEVNLMGYNGSCVYNKEHTELTFTINVNFKVKLGAAAKSRKQQFSYFVALPQFYPQNNAKQIFTVNLEFPEGVDVVNYRDEPVEITIPVKDSETGHDFIVYIGLQLDKNMLEYNRMLNSSKY